MFSQTVKLSASMKCWKTMPMPWRMAAAGVRKCCTSPSTRIVPFVGLMGAVQRLHQRRLAGAVLADDRVDRAAADLEVDAVVGDDAGEALDDVAQFDRVGLGLAGRGPPLALHDRHVCCRSS